MKKFLPALIVLMICAVTFQACKKYEEGPALTLRSAKSRLKGDWKVTKYTENGENMLNYSETITEPCSSGVDQTWTEVESSDMKMTFDRDGGLTVSETYSESYGTLNYFDCTVDMASESGSYTFPGSWIMDV
jgi:hypothetical protein